LSSVELNNLAASLSTSWEQAVQTHPVDKLLEQHCYKSAAALLQLVRFYVILAKGFDSLFNVHFVKYLLIN
jgi:hypothetical protein